MITQIEIFDKTRLIGYLIFYSMVAVAQLVERLVVVQDVVGSIPISHT